jgi:hypothetical protein
MKKLFFLFILLYGVHSEFVFSQEKKQTYQAPAATLEEKRERRQNRVIKEWNTEGKRKWMDRLSVWDPEGRKIEDIEYASYGQKERVVSEYEGGDLKCIREIVYNEKNKVIRIRKFDYNPDGTKKVQYNYLTNGKLFSVKIFEYSYR